jgi:hypothetical protein
MPKLITSLDQANYSMTSGSVANDTSNQTSIEFFATLSDKLVDMVESLKVQFEELRSAANIEFAKGAVLASIVAPQMTLGVKQEYIEYIKRFGPPPNGVFDESILILLRAELGVINI